MADSTIGNLPAATSFTDDSLLVIEQAGSAKKLMGLLLRAFCQDAVQPKVAAAAESAEAAATSAEQSAADASLAEAAKLAAIAASGHYPYINSSNHHWMVWDVGANEYADTGVSAVGETGVGILSVSLLSTSGLAKTYRIFLSNGQIYDFTVNDGADGEPGETGVSVTGASVTDSGHLNITLSDGTEIDAGEIPQLVKSVNGKTGDVTLSASDVGAPSDEEFNLTSQVLSLTGNDMVKIDDMFTTDYISAFLVGCYAKDAVYVMITSSSSLTSGQTLTATPVWNGIIDSAGSVDGIQLGKWYKLRHPSVGEFFKLTAVEIKTSSGWLMSPSNYLHVRYAPNTSGYELIQTITTTDSDNSYTVTPSTPLSKVYVSVEIPANTTIPTIFYQAYNGSEVLGYAGGTVSSKTYTSYVGFGTDRDENTVESWSHTNVAAATSGGQASRLYNPKVITTAPISRVIVRLSETNKFPNGLVINVYGVKV